MTIINPNSGILFMKVGVHAQESLADIIARKSKEIDDAGYALWGYGGNTCHPRTMVQPFAKMYEENASPIFLCMQEVNSNHFAEPLRATERSIDGSNWDKIPDSINVRGSRFALVIDDLKQADLELPLDSAQVGIGLSKGKKATDYIQGQVDKACLKISERPSNVPSDQQRNVKISLTAKLKQPYAVFLRDHR